MNAPMANPRPRYSALEAVARARALVGHSTYELGTGDCDTPDDEPMDCCGFATCKVFGIKRHREGFNVGDWSSCEDDINCNSSIEDAQHAGDLFEVILVPELGALLKYPTIRIPGHPLFWGHEAIIEDISRVVVWNPEKPDYSLVDVVQCCGPNGHHPGIIATDGSIWRHHDQIWPKPEHRTVMLRVRP